MILRPAPFYQRCRIISMCLCITFNSVPGLSRTGKSLGGPKFSRVQAASELGTPLTVLPLVRRPLKSKASISSQRRRNRELSRGCKQARVRRVDLVSWDRPVPYGGPLSRLKQLRTAWHVTGILGHRQRGDILGRSNRFYQRRRVIS